MNDYSKNIQFLAKINKDEKVIGQVEKWQAHREGVLHRGFTVVLIYQNQLILQKRKHIVFDGLYDLSFSSHPIYIDNKLQDDLEAIYKSLKREWNLTKNDLLSPPKLKGRFYYQAKDPNSQYSEHEFDYIYETEIKKLPEINPEFAYEYKLVPLSTFNSTFIFPLCPWAKEIIEKKLIQ